MIVPDMRAVSAAMKLENGVEEMMLPQAAIIHLCKSQVGRKFIIEIISFESSAGGALAGELLN